MSGKLIQPEVRKMIAVRDFARLREALVGWHPADLAELWSSLGESDQVVLFRLLPQGLAAKVFAYLGTDQQKRLLKAMGQQEIAKVLNAMSDDDRTALLEELPGNLVASLIQLLTPAERSAAQALLNYPEGSVGRLMTPDFVAVPEQWTAQQVIDHIRTHGQDKETIHVVYVVDPSGKLLDDLRLLQILLCSPDTPVREICDGAFIALRATDGRKTAVDLFRRYDRTSLPVTDSRGVLLGIVTVDDALDVQEEVATEEAQRFGGLEALDEAYASAPFWHLIRKRGGWLVILFTGEMLTATAMGFFSDQINKAVVLALFVPLIISSGGNSGSQAATLVIRALALGEVTLAEWSRVLRREVFSGLALGAIIGTIGMLRIALWQLLRLTDYGPFWPLVALTIGTSLVGVVLWGTLSGSMLPFILKRWGLDPATSSAPFVATLVDVTGIVIYFSAASCILKGTLL
jgi:magnesium transporter